MIMTWGVKWGYHHLRKHPYIPPARLLHLGKRVHRFRQLHVVQIWCRSRQLAGERLVVQRPATFMCTEHTHIPYKNPQYYI